MSGRDNRRFGTVADDAKRSIRLEWYDGRKRVPFDRKFPYQSEGPENAGHSRVTIHDSQAGQEKKVIEILRLSWDNARS